MINALSRCAGLVLAIQATSTHAGPLPKFDISLLEIGTVFEWQTNLGLQSMTYLGPDDGLLKFRLLYPTEQGTALEIDGWFTAGGQTTKAVAGNRSFTLSPNDCTNTVGYCAYFINFEASKSVKIEYFGTYSSDGILVSTRSASDPEFMGFVKKQCAILDQNGISIAYFGINPDGNITWARRTGLTFEADIETMMARVEARCTTEAPVT